MTKALNAEKTLLRDDDQQGSFWHWCPGCKEAHRIVTNNAPGANWTFDGNMERPTFLPSVLIRTGHFCQGQEGKDCWCTYEERFGKKPPVHCSICHYFLQGGMLKFLGDSTHEFANKSVPLEAALPGWLTEDLK